MISWARNVTSHACSNASTSSSPSSRRNFIRLSDARLHAESSTCMYSEHGFDALMRPVFGDVCHALIVVSYCTPGSVHSQAACAIWRSSSRASAVVTTLPADKPKMTKADPANRTNFKEGPPPGQKDQRNEMLGRMVTVHNMSMPQF